MKQILLTLLLLMTLTAATTTAQTKKNKYFFGYTVQHLKQACAIMPVINESPTLISFSFSDEMVWRFFCTPTSHTVWLTQILATGASALTWGAQNTEPHTTIPFTGITFYRYNIEHKYYDPQLKLTVFDYLPLHQ